MCDSRHRSAVQEQQQEKKCAQRCLTEQAPVVNGNASGKGPQASNVVELGIADKKNEVDARNTWDRTEKVMKISAANPLSCMRYSLDAAPGIGTQRRLTPVVEEKYTTKPREIRGDAMAFVRRKGDSFYLVHNVRRGGKVRQLHLARLGQRARITDDLMRAVSQKHPFVELNWKALRDQVNNQMDLADPNSPAVQKLVSSLRELNLDLADIFPPLLRISESPAVARELLLQLRLLQSTIQVKLDQFDRKHGGLRNAGLPMQVR